MQPKEREATSCVCAQCTLMSVSVCHPYESVNYALKGVLLYLVVVGVGWEGVLGQ